MAPCYACGEPIRLGDIVGVGYSMFGKIVYLIGRGERCEDIPVDDWRHLDGGYVIQTPEGALFHCAHEAEMALLDRAD
ncbi:MAG: hypothetical protein R3E40_03855 [Rhodocyclaceae bacterium]|jgi:hypothetical protein|nr:hypothetical protein [Rhodocyclaceae bacterium]